MDERSKIELLMKEFNMNSGQFAEEVGIKNSTLSHILNERNKPSYDVLKKILAKFQQISPEWLIMDAGPMFRSLKHSQEPTLFDNLEISASISDNYNKKSSEKKIQNNQQTVKSEENSSNQSNGELKKIEHSESVIENTYLPQLNSKSKAIAKIIIYFDDNTFEEFKSTQAP